MEKIQIYALYEVKNGLSTFEKSLRVHIYICICVYMFYEVNFAEFIIIFLLNCSRSRCFHENSVCVWDTCGMNKTFVTKTITVERRTNRILYNKM